jgi:hypothetical protein
MGPQGMGPLAAIGVYLPEGRHPIIPLFQHSLIPAAKINPHNYKN